jgi:hypothetical protein
MYIFYKIYNEYIGPYFLSHVVLQFSPVISPSFQATLKNARAIFFLKLGGACNMFQSG